MSSANWLSAPPEPAGSESAAEEAGTPGANAPMATPPAADEARLHGLDGLRAIAVVAVILYHLDLGSWFRAGFLGVDIFFAVSGFIITALLLREHDRGGGIRLGAFYLRRARRLFPPALVMLFVIAALTPRFAPDAVARLRTDIPAAFFYVSNWWQIVSGQSYFESMARPALLQHLWSLAVEEQYYIAWPLMLLALLRLGRRRAVAVAAVGLALASTAWMAVLYDARIDEGGTSRVYLGTDTHLMGLLVGSALACFWDPWKTRGAASLRALAPPRLDVIALAAALALAAMILRLNESEPPLFHGGFLLAAVASAALIVAATVPGTRTAGWLATAPMRWLGTRSYSLYLWHWPAIVWMRPLSGDAVDLALLTLSRIAFAMLCAELSYQLVERPFRRPGGEPDAPRMSALQVASALAVGFACVAVVMLESPSRVVPEAAAPVPGRLASASPPSTLVLPEVAGPGARPPGWPIPRIAPARVTVIGDSVLLGARDQIVRDLPGAHVDAEVGRQGSQGLKLARQFRDAGLLGDAVVVHLGTNGYLTEAQFRELLDQLKDRPAVVVVNVHAMRHWVQPNNALIGRVAPDFANVRVLDWHALGTRNPEFFARDGIHLTPVGARGMSNAIRASLGLPEAGPIAPNAIPTEGRRRPESARREPRRTEGARSADAATPGDRRA